MKQELESGNCKGKPFFMEENTSVTKSTKYLLCKTALIALIGTPQNSKCHCDWKPELFYYKISLFI